MRDSLEAGIRAEACAAVDDPELAALVAAIRARAEAPVRAVLFYGSGLWQKEQGQKGQVQDFYALVERQRDFDGRRGVAALGRALPPNVYYLETPGPEIPGPETPGPETPGPSGTLRAKCAVMTLDAFTAAAAGRAATPHVWARFAQPCRIVHADGPETESRLVAALADAAVTLHRKTLPLMPAGTDTRGLWCRALAETYGRELRSEGGGRAGAVFDAAPEALSWRTRHAVPLSGTGAVLDARAAPGGRLVRPARRGRRLRARGLAPLARVGGKAVTLLRVMKATVTFEGGVDYILWKIERHSGVRVEVGSFARRHPLLGGWPVLIRLYRRGAFR